VAREWGDETGRPLLFWPGLNPFGSLLLNEAGPAWAERGFRVVALAAPGMGESAPLADPEGYRPTRLADLVAAVADGLGIDSFAHVGWSWGASVGVHLAARHPGRLTALVLLDAGHTDAQDMPGWTEISLDERIAGYAEDQLSFPSWEAFFDLARERATAWRPELEDRLRAGMHEREGVIVPRADYRAAAAALHWLGLEPPSSTLPALARLDVPILLVLATRNDTTAATARFRDAVPRAEIREVDSEHDLLGQAPDETIAFVADFL
jgi:lipase